MPQQQFSIYENKLLSHKVTANKQKSATLQHLAPESTSQRTSVFDFGYSGLGCEVGGSALGTYCRPSCPMSGHNAYIFVLSKMLGTLGLVDYVYIVTLNQVSLESLLIFLSNDIPFVE